MSPCRGHAYQTVGGAGSHPEENEYETPDDSASAPAHDTLESGSPAHGNMVKTVKK